MNESGFLSRVDLTFSNDIDFDRETFVEMLKEGIRAQAALGHQSEIIKIHLSIKHTKQSKSLAHEFPTTEGCPDAPTVVNGIPTKLNQPQTKITIQHPNR